jgi:hypothetical protein
MARSVGITAPAIAKVSTSCTISLVTRPAGILFGQRMIKALEFRLRQRATSQRCNPKFHTRSTADYLLGVTRIICERQMRQAERRLSIVPASSDEYRNVAEVTHKPLVIGETAERSEKQNRAVRPAIPLSCRHELRRLTGKLPSPFPCRWFSW